MKTAQAFLFLTILALGSSFVPRPTLRQAKLSVFSELENTATVDKPVETNVEAVNRDAAVETTETEELSKTQMLMKQVKESGTAGIISYALWELAFWLISVPVVVAGYYQVVGHFPDFSDKDDLAKLGAEAFAFVNFARLAVPLRIGLALSTTPWIKENVVEKFGLDIKKDE